MDFSNYIFRSHMVGKIINVPKPLSKSSIDTLIAYSDREKGIGKPLTEKQKETLIDLKYKNLKSKEYSLTDGQKNILTQLAFSETHKRTVEINSSKLTKGLEKEKESRDILSSVLGVLFTSCDERKSNDWVTGAIDIQPKGSIIDIKSSWSWESYSKILQDKPNEIYLRQGDSYMDLWNIKEFLLCHILVDTPARLVDQEIRRYDYDHNVLDIEGFVKEESICDVKQIVHNHIFTRKGLEDYCSVSSVCAIEWFNDFVEIPEKDRIHMIPHSYDPVRIEQRNECIKLSRQFMNTVKPINNLILNQD